MAYTELYVTQGSAAAATNGGAPLGVNDGPTVTRSHVTAAQTSGATHTLEVVDAENGTGWGTTGVGDWLCFDTASAKKLCRVTALAVGGDSDVIEVFSLTGTGSIAASDKAVNVGGAWALPSTAFTFLSGIGAANWPAGIDSPRLNIKRNGTTAYSETVAAELKTLHWSSAIRMEICGYVSSPGDEDWRTSNNRVPITSSVAGEVWVIAARWTTVRNFKLTGTSNTGQKCLACAGYGNGYFNIECVYTGTSATHDQIVFTSGSQIAARCTATRTGSGGRSGFYINTVSIHLIGCVAHSCGVSGYNISTNGFAGIMGCVSYSNAGNGIVIAAPADQNKPTIIDGCTIHGNTGDGINIVGHATYGVGYYIINNILTSNAWGINIATPTSVFVLNNCFGSGDEANSSGTVSGSYTDLGGNITQDPLYADSSATPPDFKLQAGSPCKAASYPGTLTHGGSDFISYLDIGALQRQEPVDRPEMLIYGAG